MLRNPCAAKELLLVWIGRVRQQSEKGPVSRSPLVERTRDVELALYAQSAIVPTPLTPFFLNEPIANPRCRAKTIIQAIGFRLLFPRRAGTESCDLAFEYKMF